jgi:hypothetical protein
MDYQRIYNQLIERSQNRTLEGYKEKHHILPKCLGGSNDKENLVELTAREHFLCHMLLCEIYPKENKLKQALWLMSIGKQRYNTLGSYKINSRIYERLKLEFQKTLFNNSNMLGKKHTQETKIKMSKSQTGKTRTDETRNKMSESALGKVKTQEHRINISNNHPTKKAVFQIDLKGNLINEFISINEASRKTGYRVSDISACCNNKQKTAFGFVWRFK